MCFEEQWKEKQVERETGDDHIKDGEKTSKHGQNSTQSP